MRVAPLAALLGFLTVISCNTDSTGLEAGAVRVSLVVDGVDLDSDGFDVTVDRGSGTAIQGQGSATIELEPGPHTVVLGGIASNCTPNGSNTRSVTIGAADTTRISFVVVCVALTGVIEVHGSSTGLSPDLDGYGLSLDGAPIGGLLPNGVVRVAGVSGGPHSIGLSGIAPNCSLAGSTPADVNVAVGGVVRDTARVTFNVNCAATGGWLRVSFQATGTNPDPSVLVTIDSAAPLPTAQTLTAYLSAGDHAVLLTDIAPNCTVVGPNPLSAAVTMGDTTAVAFSLTCAATSIRIGAVTTGVNPDTAYLVAVDAAAPVPLASGASVVAGGLAAGGHSVRLSGIASNCVVGGPNPSAVTTIADDTVDVVFSLTCFSTPQTGVHFFLTTTGTSLDDQYHLTVYGGCGYYCYTPVWEGDVPANGTVTPDLPVGSYDYNVSQVAANCAGPAYGSFAIQAGQVTTIGLTYTCATLGFVVASVQASGVDIDTDYSIYLDGSYRTSIGAGGAVSFGVPVGAHAVSLNGVATNCSVTDPNPVSVTVDSATPSHVDFAVTCAPNPTLQVTTVTTGPNAPASYLVGVDPDYYYGYAYSAMISSTGMALVKLSAGSHIVTLDQVPLNCTVTSPNNVTVAMVLGANASLAFTVTCH